jgi:hypothetical protein
MDLVLRRASKDAAVARAYMGVVNMVAPPRSLFGPKVLPCVLLGTLKPRRAAFKGLPSHPEEFTLSPEAIAWLRSQPMALFEVRHARG